MNFILDRNIDTVKGKRFEYEMPSYVFRKWPLATSFITKNNLYIRIIIAAEDVFNPYNFTWTCYREIEDFIGKYSSTGREMECNPDYLMDDSIQALWDHNINFGGFTNSWFFRALADTYKIFPWNNTYTKSIITNFKTK